MTPTSEPAELRPRAAGLPETEPEPGDSSYGWAMFISFTAAVIAISLAVCVLALVGAWWMLGVAMAVHIGITATMMRVVFGAFGSDAYPDMEQTEAISKARLAQARLSAAKRVGVRASIATNTATHTASATQTQALAK